MRLHLLLPIALLASACGSDNTQQNMPQPDLGTLPDLVPPPDLAPAPFPAPRPDPPQVVGGNGPVAAKPTIVPVFFSNYDQTLQPSVIDFEAKVGATNYWKATTSEYGVGAATSAAPVVLTETATGTIDDTQIQTWLAGKLNSNDPAFPTATPDSIYVLHYPAEATITMKDQQGTSTSCQDFGGYHNDIRLDAMHKSALVAYAVIPTCPNFAGMGGIDAVTATESHELIEAATDLFPTDNAAYGQVDDAHIYWMFVLGGGEVGDMCAQFQSSFTKFSELPYMVQRSWSNQSAVDGHDPCVPELAGEVYFAAAPELADSIDLGGGFSTTGVSIPVGMTKTVTLDLFSDADTGGDWTVSVKDGAVLLGGSPTLDLSLDKPGGHNGDKLQLTIKSVKANQYGAAIFVVSSTMNNEHHTYFGLVGQ